jgi:hypothetical protein
MAYSADYRKAAIAFKQAGHTFKELKDVFKITSRTYYQRIEILETSGSVKVEIKRTRRRKTGPDALRRPLRKSLTRISASFPKCPPARRPLFISGW